MNGNDRDKNINAISYRIAGITRFSIDLGYGNGILNPKRLEGRFRIFENITLPSVMNQTNKNFDWIILIDPKLEQVYKERLKNAINEYDNIYDDKNEKVRVHIFPFDVTKYALYSLDWVENVIKLKPAYWVTFRLDDDDALHQQYTSAIVREIDTAFDKSSELDALLISFPHLLYWFPSDEEDKKQGELVEFDFPFNAQALSIMNRREYGFNIHQFKHTEIKIQMMTYLRRKFRDCKILVSQNVSINNNSEEDTKLDLQSNEHAALRIWHDSNKSMYKKKSSFDGLVFEQMPSYFNVKQDKLEELNNYVSERLKENKELIVPHVGDESRESQQKSFPYSNGMKGGDANDPHKQERLKNINTNKTYKSLSELKKSKRTIKNTSINNKLKEKKVTAVNITKSEEVVIEKPKNSLQAQLHERRCKLLNTGISNESSKSLEKKFENNMNNKNKEPDIVKKILNNIDYGSENIIKKSVPPKGFAPSRRSTTNTLNFRDFLSDSYSSSSSSAKKRNDYYEKNSNNSINSNNRNRNGIEYEYDNEYEEIENDTRSRFKNTHNMLYRGPNNMYVQQRSHTKDEEDAEGNYGMRLNMKSNLQQYAHSISYADTYKAGGRDYTQAQYNTQQFSRNINNDSSVNNKRPRFNYNRQVAGYQKTFKNQLQRINYINHPEKAPPDYWEKNKLNNPVKQKKKETDKKGRKPVTNFPKGLVTPKQLAQLAKKARVESKKKTPTKKKLK